MTRGHDPLSVLNHTDLPVDPDPQFAATLRARLHAALTLPNRTEGVVMADTAAVRADLNAPAAAPVPPRPATIAYLTVPDARAAIDWYLQALDAVQVGEPIVMDDGRIGHAELRLGGGVLYLADEYPELGLRAPAPQSTSVSLVLSVPDTDAALERARRHGAHIQREPYDGYGARNAVVIDPSGHRWMFSGPQAVAVPR